MILPSIAMIAERRKDRRARRRIQRLGKWRQQTEWQARTTEDLRVGHAAPAEAARGDRSRKGSRSSAETTELRRASDIVLIATGVRAPLLDV
jgi:hypothetical protein